MVDCEQVVSRSQLAFVIILNAFISLVIALTVAWVIDARRPDPEQLAAIYTPQPASSLPAGQTSGAAGATIDLPPTATQPALSSVQAESTPTTASTAGEPVIYVVQGGDSLSGIASKFGVTVPAIMEINKLENPDYVFSGQRIIIPVEGTVPTATPGAPANGSSSGAATGLQIRAIGAVGDLTNEYVEITNDGDLAFNLQGWKLQRSGGPDYTFADALIFPGGSIRVYSTSGADTTISRYWGQSAALWQSSGEATLLNVQGQSVSTYRVP